MENNQVTPPVEANASQSQQTSTTTTSTSEAGQSNAGNNSANSTTTQSTGTEQQSKTSLDRPSDAAKITKAQETPPPAQEAPFKPDYTGMIEGFIAGNLTDADYEAIEKSGLSRQDFEFMAAGHKALQEKHTAELHAVVGGPEAYKQLQEFGAHNLNQAQIDAFNSALESGDPALAEIAVLGLQAKMLKAQGNPPAERVTTSSTSSTSVDEFGSSQEVINAMKDYRYGKDQAYTQEVNAKRARSKY